MAVGEPEKGATGPSRGQHDEEIVREPKVKLRHEARTLAAALGMSNQEFDEAVDFVTECLDMLRDRDEPYSVGIERIVNHADFTFPQKAFCLFSLGRIVGETETKGRALDAFEHLIEGEYGHGGHEHEEER